MGMHHFYCSVSGARHFESRGEFRNTVCEWVQWGADDADDDNGNDVEDESGNAKDIASPKNILSDVVRNGLLYSQEDVDASSNFVVLSPFEREEDGTISLLEFDYNDWPSAKETEQFNISEVFDVNPDGDPDEGDFRNEDYTFNMYSHSAVLIMYTAYLIMKQAAPRLTPHIIYQLVLHPGLGTIVEDIDYGPVKGIHLENYCNWTRTADADYGSDQDQLDYWHRLLTQEGKTDEEILHDAWRGPGNMWVFVRPDRFPIAETLAAKPLLVISGYYSSVGTVTLDTLPLDILIHVCHRLPVKSLHMILCTNKRLRGEILPQIDMIAYQQIITHEPYLLPAGPFDLDEKHGREEIDWWDMEWAKGGIAKEEMNFKIPWFLYSMECSKSMSMWNRRRIWGIAKQLENLAIDEYLLLQDGADMQDVMPRHIRLALRAYC